MGTRAPPPSRCSVTDAHPSYPFSPRRPEPQTHMHPNTRRDGLCGVAGKLLRLAVPRGGGAADAGLSLSPAKGRDAVQRATAAPRSVRGGQPPRLALDRDSRPSPQVLCAAATRRRSTTAQARRTTWIAWIERARSLSPSHPPALASPPSLYEFSGCACVRACVRASACVPVRA